jgi:beta-galactosidase
MHFLHQPSGPVCHEFAVWPRGVISELYGCRLALFTRLDLAKNKGQYNSTQRHAKNVKGEIPVFSRGRPVNTTTTVRRTVWLCAMVLGFAAPLMAQTYSPPATDRMDISLDSGWRFIRQDVPAASNKTFDDSGWSPVDVPHEWNNLDGQDGGGYYQGPGWYRRHYIPGNELSGQRFFLKFDGANIVADVWVNGSYVGQHRGGFAAFAFDVTTNLSVGADNLIAVRVDNTYNANVPPLQADFTFHGGMYRKVHLLALDPVHITPLDYASPGVYLKTTGVSSKAASLQITALEIGRAHV